MLLYELVGGAVDVGGLVGSMPVTATSRKSPIFLIDSVVPVSLERVATSVMSVFSLSRIYHADTLAMPVALDRRYDRAADQPRQDLGDSAVPDVDVQQNHAGIHRKAGDYR